ncbi:MAG TPA: hypothetical protein VF763_13095 [Candidatus Limnocylindrales bacterium]
MLRRDRRRRSVAELSTPDLILRIRWARARKAACEPESPAWRIVDGEEGALIAALRDRFGVENLTPTMLEWLVSERLGPQRTSREELLTVR